MKTLQNLEVLEKHPVFSNSTPGREVSDNYVNLYLHRLFKKHLIIRIAKNIYTLHNDPFIIASRIVWPSYISCWSSLNFHNFTNQVPHSIFVVIPYYRKAIKFQNTEIIFIKTKSKNMFGYEKVNYRGFEIFVADKEKSIIDSALLKQASFSSLKEIVEDNLNYINTRKFIKYLKRIGNKSLIKRFGYLFDKLGKNYYNELKIYIDNVYIPLDYTKGKTGIKNKIWKIIENA